MKDFIAFDFETANQNRHSICSVGLVFVENGQIVDTVYSLINPEEKFDTYNTAIHGIKEKDVEDAPTFPDFYESIKDRLNNKHLVAHYLAFDGYALKDVLKKYLVDPVNHYLLCTYQMSKRLIPGESSYTLKSLSKKYNINLEHHHHALDDAVACAKLFLSLVDEYEIFNDELLFKKTFIKPGVLNKEKFKSSFVNTTDSLSFIETNEEADEDHVFFKKNIVFTGSLQALTRTEAAKMIADLGATPQKGITKTTNYIVVGDFDSAMLKGEKSSKLKKAESLIQEGFDLEIISEEEFFKMVSS